MVTLAGARQATAGSSRTNRVLGRPEPAQPQALTPTRANRREPLRTLTHAFVLAHACVCENARVHTIARARLWVGSGWARGPRADTRRAAAGIALPGPAGYVRLVTTLQLNTRLSHRSSLPPMPSPSTSADHLETSYAQPGRAPKKHANSASILARERTPSPLALAVPHTARANAAGHRTDRRSRVPTHSRAATGRGARARVKSSASAHRKSTTWQGVRTGRGPG